METKRCPQCGEQKPLSKFYASPKRPGGYYQYCRKCSGARAHAWYRANNAGQRQARIPPEDIPTHKPCRVCKLIYPATAEFFHPRVAATDGLVNECRSCRAEWRKANRIKLARKTRVWQKQRRYKILCHYSQSDPPVCACCSESMDEFLALDHIDGQGSKELKEHGGRLAEKLQREGFPPGYQVLCHNCNMAKAFYGICPHQRNRTPEPA